MKIQLRSTARRTLQGPIRIGRDPLNERPLRLTDRAIRTTAKRLGPAESLATLCWRAACREWTLRLQRRINFRRNANGEACRAYEAMQIDDFIDINGRQAWANWRTIPRSLNGELPDRPLMAVDLCCGVGDSTAVLAYYCAPGSQILGLEFNPTFVDFAREREYVNRRERIADVSFRAQSVLQTFCDANDAPLADECVDLVNAAGAVGCHFDRDATECLARECGRVVRSGGLATIDAGRGGADVDDLIGAFCDVGFDVVRQTRSCVLDLGRQLCLRKIA